MWKLVFQSFSSKALIQIRWCICSVVSVVIFTGFHPAVADGEPPFDETRSVILPSEDAASILKRIHSDSGWSTDDWSISSSNLNDLETALAAAMGKVSSGLEGFKAHDFYRQYMPARWKEHRVIVVNGFYKTASDLFPDRGIATDQWKHKLATAFGGGCAYWYAVYIVDQNRLKALKTGDGSRHATLVCNGPK
jgi:hypothetical protein